MSDTTSTLLERSNSLRPQRYERIVLRSSVSVVFGFICLLSVVFWIRSYTWRDRLVVPLSETRYCRIDSDRGKFQFASYGPNMGEMTFSVTALSHRDISEAWNRFMNVPEPGPGEQWRWERTTTGRFFIHAPHWFVVGIALVFTAMPWLRWRYSLRTILVAITLLATTLGLWGWATTNSKTTTAVLLPVVEIDEDGQFEEILKAVDRVAGKRLLTKKEGAMIFATYQFSGSIDTVMEVIDPIAKRIGYSLAEQGLKNQDFDEGQEHMKGITDMKMEIDLTGSEMYQHKNGNVIHVQSMDVTNNILKASTKMKMVSIQLVNPQKMTGFPQQEAKEE